MISRNKVQKRSFFNNNGSGCYEMDGEATLSCDGSGWDHEVPTCKRKTCPWRQPDFSRKYNYDVEWEGEGTFLLFSVRFLAIRVHWIDCTS